MLKALKKAVCDANLRLPASGLVVLTWGNVSGIDRPRGLVVIKPSGVPYDGLEPDDMVVVDLTGKVVEGRYKPSSDTPTHLRLYGAFPKIGGVAHTHAVFSVAFAQASTGIPAYGTTHADHFRGTVPCTRELTETEINADYEDETGRVIAETFKDSDPMAIPAALVARHGPFTWGIGPEEAAINSVALEEIAKMAFYSSALSPNLLPASDALLDKHYFRKHGSAAYYGQG